VKKILAAAVLVVIMTFQWMNSSATQRFPKPDFESGYIQPETLLPQPRAEFLAWMDVAVLLGSLAFVSWLVLKKRSRNGVFWASLFSLAYFGFYRQGCVCAIGSIQNVTLGLFDASYAVPLTILAFFVFPLIFTLLFGRTFCAGVCPFGAIQDLVSLRPLSLGTRLNAVLGLIPYVYLGLAILFAATGTDFIICRYDPFVGIFRFNATFGMFLFAGTLLVSGIFIARPYCRFLCPYGVILNWISRFSKWHITITPAACIQCRLCEDSCPYDAINKPVEMKVPGNRSSAVKKFILVSLLIPVFMALGGWTVSGLHETLSRVNSKVRLAEEVMNPVTDPNTIESKAMTAFKASGKPSSQLYSEAATIVHDFYVGGWIFGGFIGLVIGGLIAGKLVIPYRKDYVPDKGRCFSCTRCVDYCPVKK
jgi:NosR/NirI family transcriptional regulator, nitrous oxide reductase regulator